VKTFIGLLGVVLIGLIVCNPMRGSTTTYSLIILDHQSGIDFTDSAIELVSRYAEVGSAKTQQINARSNYLLSQIDGRPQALLPPPANREVPALLVALSAG
jgi:hypothetical protein